MIRSVLAVARTTPLLGWIKSAITPQNVIRPTLVSSAAQRCFSIFQPTIGAPLCNTTIHNSPNILLGGVRTVIKFSLRKGKRKSVKVVLKKFYRLHWGGWIRRRAGAHKKLWKKSSANKRRLRQHIFCNATQSRLLDKMVGSYWRRPKYYVEDPYEPYHTREEFIFTSRKPRPYFPPEQS